MVEFDQEICDRRHDDIQAQITQMREDHALLREYTERIDARLMGVQDQIEINTISLAAIEQHTAMIADMANVLRGIHMIGKALIFIIAIISGLVGAFRIV